MLILYPRKRIHIHCTLTGDILLYKTGGRTLAIQKISIAHFSALAKQYPVLDVRSPSEYAHAHMPGAYSLPLFTDEERKIVGTAYKQDSSKAAIKIGLDYFGVKMRKMVEQVENLVTSHGPASEMNNPGFTQHSVLVHCWRGGMRSAGVAWLLDLYGFKVYSLQGGYKEYRRWVRLQFEKKYTFIIVSGYTGSGKTLALHQLEHLGKAVIDLEKLAGHKGSAFGALGQKPQPSQEMFENLLAESLNGAGCLLADKEEQISAINSLNNVVYIEDESRRIGLVNIPNELWNTMQDSPTCIIDVPFEERLSFLTKEYGEFGKENLVNAILRIQKRLGGSETKAAISFLLENDCRECFRILLKYYDRCYEKAMANRKNKPALLNKITCTGVDVKTITNKLINERTNA